MREVRFSDGTVVPALGLGTWRMAELAQRRKDEIAAIRRSLDRGLSVIDTAEMYGEGAAEELVGEAIAGRRDDAFIASKVYPHNAGARSAIQACERSLRRLKVEALDLYLLHWRGRYPLAETVAAFERLRADGKIQRWGVSNFDLDDMEELGTIAAGDQCAADQVLYNLARRGVEFDLLPWCRGRGLPIMAYSPIEQGRLDVKDALAAIASKHDVTPHAVALAWTITRPGVIAIPKTGRPERVDSNAAALDLALDEADMAALDQAFPPPRRKQPLAIL